jgi:hypothetical protein
VEIIKSLDKSPIVDNYIVRDFKSFKDGFYISIAVKLIDNSDLYISEYIDEFERNYSYHWQDFDKTLRIRFDNAPYHRSISTYPHHKHLNNVVLENNLVTFSEIMNYIHNQIMNL